jgi:hypothetical protein
MLVTAETSLVIEASPEAIWDYAWDPEHWTASNPEEHFGLEFHTPENRPRTGATFRQCESVAGVYAELRGHFLVVERPRLLVWAGIATYPLLKGLIRARIPEGGVLRLVNVGDGVCISHDVFMDFPRSALGRLLHRLFTGRLNGRQAVYDHTFKELVYFKRKLEALGSGER